MTEERALIAFQWDVGGGGGLRAWRSVCGCWHYDLGCVAHDPDTFVFFERWASQQALDAHFNSPGFQAFWGERMQYLERDVEVKFLSAV